VFCGPDETQRKLMIMAQKLRVIVQVLARAFELAALPQSDRCRTRCRYQPVLAILRMCQPAFPFCQPGQHRLHVQPPPLERFSSSFPSRATPAAEEAGQLCLLRARKTRKCLIPSDFLYTSPFPSLLRPVCLPAAALYPVGKGSAGVPSGPGRTIALKSRRVR